MDDEYRRGHAAGGVEERLAGHDKHFAAINGSLKDVAEQLALQTLALQRLADQHEADARARVATAEALRLRSESTWTPITRFIAGLVAFATVTATAVGLYVSLTHR